MKTKERGSMIARKAIQREDYCPFSLELLEACVIRKSITNGNTCPFSLEQCIQPPVKVTPFFRKTGSKRMIKKKENCWEFMQCGRVQGGLIGGNSGVCLASTDRTFDGFHDGKNSGRACWMISGTLCNEKIQSSYAFKFKECSSCKFYLKVREEEGRNFIPPEMLLKQLAG